jgi:carbon-monoxide dehydrogenase large subunit
MAKVAESAWLNWDVPESDEIGLEERYSYNPDDISYSYATHAAEVCVDLDTGIVTVEGYWVAHDSGVMVNPMICDGQILGGIAQGLGIALHEDMRWGEGGQPLTTTYLDYVLPVSADMPTVDIEHMVTPSPFVPGGMKGLGEGGVIPTPAAIANAVANAVPEIAGSLLQTPLSPSRMWHLIEQAGLHD